jgi:plastocyanin
MQKLYKSAVMMHSTHSAKNLGLAFACLAIIGTMAVVPSLPFVGVAAEGSNVNVSITPGASTKTNDAYSPNPVSIDVGDTVIWTNNDPPNYHTAVSGTPSGGPDGKFGGTPEAPFSKIIAPHETSSHTFTEPGAYPYYCALHPNMVGRVIVGQSEDKITVRTDKSVYEIGDDVKITGQVEPPNPDLQVLLRITNEDGELVRVDLATVEQDGRYSYEFHVGGALFEPKKSYSVNVAYRSAVAETEFSISRTKGGCEGLAPTITGTDRDDVLVGTDGNDVIDGLRGNDVIRGQDGNDVICGGPGFDEIFAGEGDDRVYGGRGNDELYGELGNDRLWGGTGWDKLFGGVDDDRIFGGKGNDMLQGDEGDDRLDGQIGDDILDGVPDGGNSFSDIEVELDDIEYGQGDDVWISGTINGAEEGEEVDITVHEPDGGSDSVDTQVESGDGEFGVVYQISGSADDGVYQVEVEFGTEDPVFSFFYVDEDDDDVEFVTDEESYAPGDSVEIVGEVADVEPGVEEVEITVIDPTGEQFVTSADVELDNSDEFEYDFDLDDEFHGRYAIIIEYDNVESGFLVFEVEQDGGSSSITASLSRTSYLQGDRVEITGEVEEIEPGDDVVITVEDPDGAEIYDDAAEPGPDRSFAFSFDLDEDAETGTYEVAITYISSQNQKVLAFSVSSNNSGI